MLADAALYIVAAVLAVYRISKAKDVNSLFVFAAMLVFGGLVFTSELISAVPVLVSGIVIFDGLMFTYGKRLNYAYMAIAVVYLLYYAHLGAAHMAQVMLFGLVSEVGIFKPSHNGVTLKSTEVQRDLVQIGLGAVILLVFVFATVYADRLTIALILLGFLVSNYSITFKKSGIAKSLGALEREYTTFGHGAIWLALGSLVAIGFLHMPYVAVALISIFLGDAAATIVGVNYGKHRLPYNRKKSFEGSIASFLVILALSYFLIGPLAVAVAFIAAFVESLPWHIDDNFDVAVVVTLFFIALLAL